MLYLVSPILIDLLNTNCKLPMECQEILNVNLTLFVILFEQFGHYKLTRLQELSRTIWFFIQISIIYDNSSLHECQDAKYADLKVDELKVSEDDSTCKLIHNKCH